MNSKCLICTNKFTIKLRLKIKCESCNKATCCDCLQTWLLQDSSTQTCMHCKEFIPFEVLYRVATKKFIKQYMLKLTDNEMRKEQTIVKYELEEAGRIRKIEILWSRIAKLDRHLKRFSDDIEIQQLRSRSQTELERLERGEIRSNDSAQVESFIVNCPTTDCPGTMLIFGAETVTCQKCLVTVCTKCLEPHLDNHICDPEIIKTMEEVAKTTKKCPNCSVRIQKTDGCDQMFCVKCHVAFSWKTTRIHKGAIHNPHYFEWLQATTQNNTLNSGNSVFHDVFNALIQKKLFDLPRMIQELMLITTSLRDHVYNLDFLDRKKQELRGRFVTKCIKKPNEIDAHEKCWSKQLLVLLKKQPLLKAVLIVLDEFLNFVTNIVTTEYNNSTPIEFFNKFSKNGSVIVEIENQISTYNKQLRQLRKKYCIDSHTILSVERVVCGLIPWDRP